MGAEPKTALNIVGFPKGALDLEVLREILKGGAERVKEAGAVIIGGHSIIDRELKYGMAVTGIVHPDRVIRNVGVQEGDALVLTKPLGTGIIATALKQRKASKESVREAVSSMVTLNRTGSEIMQNFPVHACTDVTGYSLLGHATEMAMGSGVTIVLESARLPILRGAARLAKAGFLTGGCKRNREYLRDKIIVDRSIPEDLVEVAFDPQTSGGLLIALPAGEAPALVEELQASGIRAAAIIGHSAVHQAAWVTLV
jgi:selenide,water dikinase